MTVTVKPFMQRQVRSELTEKAEIASVEVFAANLRKLLLTPPVRGKSVLAIDPGMYQFWPTLGDNERE